jgi:hypothetical protein
MEFKDAKVRKENEEEERDTSGIIINIGKSSSQSISCLLKRDKKTYVLKY